MAKVQILASWVVTCNFVLSLLLKKTLKLFAKKPMLFPALWKTLHWSLSQLFQQSYKQKTH